MSDGSAVAGEITVGGFPPDMTVVFSNPTGTTPFTAVLQLTRTDLAAAGLYQIIFHFQGVTANCDLTIAAAPPTGGPGPTPIGSNSFLGAYGDPMSNGNS